MRWRVLLACSLAVLFGMAARPGGRHETSPRSAAPRRAAAHSSIKTYTYSFGPIRTGDFATHWVDQKAGHPRVDGIVIAMNDRLVDHDTGKPVSITRAMLHHLYFRRVQIPAHKTACAVRPSEVFYSTGEEDETLTLP